MSFYARGAQILGLWLAEQKATDIAESTRRVALGASCETCSAVYTVRYGRHSGAWIIRHPMSAACPNGLLCFHSGAKSEEEAWERFAERKAGDEPCASEQQPTQCSANVTRIQPGLSTTESAWPVDASNAAPTFDPERAADLEESPFLFSEAL